jgi:hypothetical protein
MSPEEPIIISDLTGVAVKDIQISIAQSIAFDSFENKIYSLEVYIVLRFI